MVLVLVAHVGWAVIVFFQQIDRRFHHAFDIAHEVVRRAQRNRVDIHAFEYGGGAVEFARVDVIPKAGKDPTVVSDVIDAGESAEPVEILAGHDIQRSFPIVPKRLAEPMDLAADRSGQINSI